MAMNEEAFEKIELFHYWKPKVDRCDLQGFEQLCFVVHQMTVDKGFWNDAPRNKGEMIALIHSEVSEVLEAVRKPRSSEKIPQFSQEAEELADVVIRVMDYAYGHNLDLVGAIKFKVLHNATRPHKHGKKF